MVFRTLVSFCITHPLRGACINDSFRRHRCTIQWCVSETCWHSEETLDVQGRLGLVLFFFTSSLASCY